MRYGAMPTTLYLSVKKMERALICADRSSIDCDKVCIGAENALKKA
jgi:hypothetical protein